MRPSSFRFKSEAIALIVCLGFLAGCGGSGSSSNTPTPPVEPSPTGPASGSEFFYGFFGGNVRVAPLNPTTGTIGPTVDADLNVSPVIEYGTAVQYGKFIYVIGFDQLYARESGWRFSVTGTNGQLTLSNDSPFSVAGSYPLLDTKHGRLYLAGGVIGQGGITTFELTSYNIDPITGVLGSGSLFMEKPSTGTFLRPAIDPLGRFIYGFGPTSAGEGIYVYLIDPTTGNLSEAAGSPFSLGPSTGAFGSLSEQILPSPSGNFLYVYLTGSVNAIYAFSVDPTTGILTQISGSPIATDGNIGTTDAIAPNGNALYAQEQIPGGGGDVEQTFALDPIHGTVATAPSSSFQLATNFFGDSAIDGSGSVMITANQVPGPGVSIYSFTIDPATGALTPASGSPFTMSANSAGTYESFQSYLIVKIP